MISYARFFEAGVHLSLDTPKLAGFGETMAFFSHPSNWVYFFIHSHHFLFHFLWYYPWSSCLVYTTTSMSSAIRADDGWDGMGWSGFVMRGPLDIPADYFFFFCALVQLTTLKFFLFLFFLFSFSFSFFSFFFFLFPFSSFLQRM